MKKTNVNIEELSKKIKSELTAISTGHSTSADIVGRVLQNTGVKALDYGCGTGRNIDYIYDEYHQVVDGCDIPEQLARQKYEKAEENGSIVTLSKNLPCSSYEVILCSHVLNVILDDNVKQFVIDDIARLLRIDGSCYLEVRTKNDINSSSTKEEYQDGYIIPRGKNSATYQEIVSQEKIEKLAKNAGLSTYTLVNNSSKHIVVLTK